jgi:hypothetical protein
VPVRDGLTEQDFNSALELLQGQMTPADWTTLMELHDMAGQQTAEAAALPIPARTRTGRMLKLFRRYGQRFRESLDL